VSHYRQPNLGGRRMRWSVTALAKDYSAGAYVPQHRHRRGQLLFAESGVARVTTKEGIWIVPPERALWIPVGMVHEARAEGEVALRTLYLDCASSKPFGTHCKTLVVSKLLRELILEVVRAYRDKDAGRIRMMSPLLLHELLASEQGGVCIPAPSDSRLVKACDRLLSNASQARLDELAYHAGASSRTLTRLFERELRMTFARWRQHVILARALNQMACGDSIKKVAHDAGYANCSAFSAMFRRVLGITPTGYLRQPRTEALGR
jgi:AraC-like DNA-binding protein/mannose-6-phosphate isomerase-like protein (cupin superfamily)